MNKWNCVDLPAANIRKCCKHIILPVSLMSLFVPTIPNEFYVSMCQKNNTRLWDADEMAEHMFFEAIGHKYNGALAYYT